MDKPKPTILKTQYTNAAEKNIVDFVAQKTQLSKIQIKKAMTCGALRLKKQNRGKFKHVRKATNSITKSDYLEFHYNPEIVNTAPATIPNCIHRNQHYSLWQKPVDYLSQGNIYGDHWSILRFIEKKYGRTFLIHRLDKEITGIMIFAHDRLTAKALSEIVSKNRIVKTYYAKVLGDLSPDYKNKDIIDLTLDGKKAETRFEIINYDSDRRQTTVKIQLITGRYHQIRRHFKMISNPIIGDPKYGKGNKNTSGLQLIAYGLTFVDPTSQNEVHYNLGEEFLTDFLR